jgi:glycosyltransferase involved in cell wall biosynthesis
MQEMLGFELRYIASPVRTRALKPAGYAVQALRTARMLRESQRRGGAETVWCQTPPSFMPHLLLALRLYGRGFQLVADCHNGHFVPPWSRLPGSITALNRCDLVLVHNEEIRVRAESLGVDPARLAVLEDPPPRLIPPPRTGGVESPYVLVPCSFKPDEPIDVVLAAAGALPEVTFHITGNRRRAEAQGFVAAAPRNVVFTGFLPVEAFERLLWNADVVLGVTREEGIQLSVANEALGAHRPLVLSDTRILRRLFGDAALFAPNAPEPMAAVLRTAIARKEELERHSAALKILRQQAWRRAVTTILDAG